MYTPETLRMVASLGQDGRSNWFYETTDLLGDIGNNRSYFTDGRARGMKPRDLITLFYLGTTINGFSNGDPDDYSHPDGVETGSLGEMQTDGSISIAWLIPEE